MAQIRTTRYVCDSCEKDAAKKRDLRRFSIHNDAWDEVHFDLCADCEQDFLHQLASRVPGDQDVSSIARQEKK